MGAGASAGDSSALSFVSDDVVHFDLTCKDVMTPRGETAKAEVQKLRKLMVARHQIVTSALARARFSELDLDKSGFLENNELVGVAEWTMKYFGNKMGDNAEQVKTKIMRRLDGNKDGKLDVDEFGKLFSMIIARNDLVQRATNKFTELDKDNSGFLEAAEIDEVVMWTLQAFPNDEDLSTYKKHILNAIDSNGDGKVRFRFLFVSSPIAST